MLSICRPQVMSGLTTKQAVACIMPFHPSAPAPCPLPSAQLNRALVHLLPSPAPCRPQVVSALASRQTEATACIMRLHLFPNAKPTRASVHPMPVA